MKTKLFTGLALAACLLIGQPAFAREHKGGGGHHVAAVHRAGRSRGGSRIAAVSHHASRGRGVASSRTPKGRTSGRTFASRPSGSTRSVAFGGSQNSSNGNRNGHGQFAFSSHRGWSHDQEYYWNGHHYRWYDNGWFIIDAYPYGAYPYGSYGSGSVAAQVQADLARDGYYQGPVDGVVGPATSAAIAAFQRDNGLPVTGNINRGLLSYLGV